MHVYINMLSIFPSISIFCSIGGCIPAPEPYVYDCGFTGRYEIIFVFFQLSICTLTLKNWLVNRSMGSSISMIIFTRKIIGKGKLPPYFICIALSCGPKFKSVRSTRQRVTSIMFYSYTRKYLKYHQLKKKLPYVTILSNL